MLVVAGEIRIDPEKRDAGIAAALEMMAETQLEDGCVTYVFSADLEDPSIFRIFEEWESLEHLEAHFAAPHMAVFLSKLAELDVSHRMVHRYDVSAITLL